MGSDEFFLILALLIVTNAASVFPFRAIHALKGEVLQFAIM
jgi:hypothetical protein